MNTFVRVAALFIAAFLLVACGSSAEDVDSGFIDFDPSEAFDRELADTETSETFPSVIAAKATAEGGRSYTFAVTISSPYDSPERYADAWRVLGPNGEEYGIRVLTHDHAGEQPFTRSQSGIVIPAGVDVVTIEGRDLLNGWGGPTIDVAIPA